MTGPLPDYVAAAHGPRPHPLHGDALVHEGLRHLERVQVAYLLLFGIGNRRIEKFLNDPRGMERRKGENIQSITHHLASNEINDLPCFARCYAYMSDRCACFHLTILFLMNGEVRLLFRSARLFRGL